MALAKLKGVGIGCKVYGYEQKASDMSYRKE